MSFWFHRLDKILTKLFLDFCSEFFCSFLGGFLEAFWAFWGLSIQYHKQGSLQKAPKSFQEAPRKVKKMQYYFCYHLCRSISKSSNYILLHYLNSLSNAPTTRYKKLQGRNPEIISLVFWKKLLFHKDILKLTDL